MLIADLHIHSKYARATSRDLDPEHLDLWARRKGIQLLGTGDFTHPAWREELREALLPAEDGLYRLRDDRRIPEEGAAGGGAPRFVLSAEISSIYKKGGRVRKVHNVILLPGLEEADRLSARLAAIGNIHSDGRPILGLDCRDLLEITLETCPRAVFIPAHIWTPHFSLLGAFSGFDTIEECFEDLTPHIFALETGLSSDPAMNWRLSSLDRYTLVSHSDAHSPQKLGREADLMDIEYSYDALAAALRGRGAAGFKGTIEFYPEEGKYHLDGHRKCEICLSPAQTRAADGRCPVCGGRLTVGVLHRVEELADRPEGYRPPDAPGYESLVPLPEIIAASTGASAASVKTARRYQAMLQALGPEFTILRDLPLEAIRGFAGPLVAEGVRRVRAGEIRWEAGYDGAFGRVRILDEAEIGSLSGQISLFPGEPVKKRAKKPAGGPPPACQDAETAAAIAPAPPAAPAAGRQETDPLAGLNEEQRAAVLADQPTVAVVAGPGAGKTGTLVARIRHLLEQGIQPQQITAVTFTSKAAAEMRQRLAAGPQSGRAKKVTIGTFHAICLGYLRSAGCPAVLAGEGDCRRIAAETVAAAGSKLSPGRLLRMVSCRKNGADGAEELSDRLYDAYCAGLAAAGFMDFDDLLLETLRRLEEDPAAAAARAPFSHLLVDEFQDINPVQYRLIRAWKGQTGRLFVIGDPDQSIYGFRGADAGCFARLLEDCPDTRVIRLTKNYRCTPEIIGCAMPVIQKNPSQAGARRLEAVRPSGGKVRLLRADDGFGEALYIAKEIGRMVGGMDMLEAGGGERPSPWRMSPGGNAGRPLPRQDRPRGFADIAVLYRTHRQAEALETCLGTEGIPYMVTGRDDFLLAPSVQGLVCLCRLIHALAEERAVSPGILVGALQTFFKEDPSVTAYLEAVGAAPAGWRTIPRPAAVDPVMTLAAAYADRKGGYRPRALLEALAAALGIGADPAVDKLLSAALFHDDLSAFLETLLLGGEADVSRIGGKTYTADAVRLMTLHGAKGLEFPVVFLCGASDGLLPLEQPGRPADLEEERRLFFVGLTRAREELLISTYGRPSAFLQDLPSALLLEERATVGSQPYGGRQLSFF